MNAFSEKLADYDVGPTYNALESAYRGQYKFDPRVAPLSNPEASIHFLPDPKAGVVSQPALQHCTLDAIYHAVIRALGAVAFIPGVRSQHERVYLSADPQVGLYSQRIARRSERCWPC